MLAACRHTTRSAFLLAQIPLLVDLNLRCERGRDTLNCVLCTQQFEEGQGSVFFFSPQVEVQHQEAPDERKPQAPALTRGKFLLDAYGPRLNSFSLLAKQSAADAKSGSHGPPSGPFAGA